MRAGFFQKCGFTMIELIVAIAVIGVLATIGTMSYSEVRQKARNDVLASELQQMQLALDVYKSENGHYPSLAASGCDSLYLTNRSGSRGSCGDNYIPGLVPDFIPVALSHEVSSNPGCEIQYIPSSASDPEPSSYKLQARNCVVGVTVSRNHSLYRCGASCTDPLCAETQSVNQQTFAVYSAGSECASAGGL